ncbi:HNH endonuclease [Palleronia caenipelagi]|uniref:HNH endonuclease n=1 Tax=Palleronia caenipelagi TaxID=2489174 RepID=A0A547Q691_9RHOB|nr:HNH endonuclease [Palleronia caenipelagi]TRD21899.1 HNH endonuclease [Palleronia caenipelagi]
MPRLTSVPARVAGQASRLGVADRSEAERHRQRDQMQPWRGWYKTARWQKLRRKVIKRDGCICQETGVLLVGVHPAPDSPVVDHIRPHRGNAKLFWDERNLQTVSKAYHDREKQSLEARGLS